jgi:dihydroorotase
MLAAALRLVHNGTIKLGPLLKAMSARPSELLGLPGGTLKPGSPADVIVVDIDMPWVLDPDTLRSKCKNTPFDEARLQGRVLRTIVAGRTVFEYAPV